MARSEMIWVHEDFYKLLKPRIVRDKRERRVYQKLMPNQKFYDSFAAASKDLAQELQKGFFRP